MITADALARELGCTLSDLEDLDGAGREMLAVQIIGDDLADDLRAAWSEFTGVDYTK